MTDRRADFEVPIEMVPIPPMQPRAKRTPQTDPREVSLADAVSMLSLLALGDREKSTPEQRRAWADALLGVIAAAAELVGADIKAPILPKLEAIRGGTRCGCTHEAGDSPCPMHGENGEVPRG